MTTILVLHEPTEAKYLWLGASAEDRAAVCDAAGAIRLLPIAELRVLEIDGRPIDRYRRFLEPPGSEPQPDPAKADAEVPAALEACPACDMPVLSDTRECPSCGLTLIFP